MDEVEYCIVRKNNRLAADEIKKLPRGTIPTEQVYIYMYMYMYKMNVEYLSPLHLSTYVHVHNMHVYTM